MSDNLGSISIDIDGVLSDFILGFTTLAVKFGLIQFSYSTHEQQQWKFDFPVDTVWKLIDSSKYFWLSLDPLISKEEINQIHELNKQLPVYFISNRKGVTAKQQTEAWMHKYGLPQSVILINKREHKKLLVEPLNIVWSLEDRGENAIDFKESGVNSYLIDRNYNKQFPCARVNSIGEFINLIREDL